jgi:hypothetical protein
MYTANFYLLILYVLYNCSLLAGSMSGFSSCARGVWMREATTNNCDYLFSITPVLPFDDSLLW